MCPREDSSGWELVTVAIVLRLHSEHDIDAHITSSEYAPIPMLSNPMNLYLHESQVSHPNAASPLPDNTQIKHLKEFFFG